MALSPDVAAEVTEENTCTYIGVSSSLGNRKSEDEGEETESSVETTDDESEPETEPVFGYDSFEDRDYFSYSEDELIESVKPFLDYRGQIYKTRGFDVDPDSIPEDMITGCFPIVYRLS